MNPKSNAVVPAAQISENIAATNFGAKLLGIALAIPGVVSVPNALAETAPAQSFISLKYLDYKDRQTSGDRMHVASPTIYALVPLGEKWSIEGSGVLDAMSGASPRYHSTLSGGSGKGIHDYRKGADAKITRYFDRAAVSLGASISTEHDYFSRALSLDARFDSADKNTTYAFGLAASNDRINSENQIAIGEKKNSVELLFGITQILTPQSLVQSNITYAHGHGYFSDPYKLLDTRPNVRRSLAWLTRYNHYIPQAGGAINASYRYYDDSFGVKGHTLETTWRQPVADTWTLSPMLRYYSQSKAKFYFDPPFPNGSDDNRYYSADQRLAAFGAITWGLRIDKTFGDCWSANAKIESQTQKGSWRLGGGGSPGLQTFYSRAIIFGLSKTF